MSSTRVVQGLDAAVDPFYAMKENLSQRSKSLQSEFDQWREKLKACNTATDSSYKESETRLRELLKSVDGEAKILGKVVASIEKNRDQFAHIDDAELRERSRFSKDIKDIVKKVKFELDSEQTNAKKRADVNKELNSVRIDAAERQRKSKLEAEKDAARDQRANELTQLQEKQDALIRDQDSILGSMSDALARLNNQAVIINEEIENQAILIDDVEGKMDDATNRVEINIQKLERLMKTKKRWQIWVILILIMILAVLVFVLMS